MEALQQLLNVQHEQSQTALHDLKEKIEQHSQLDVDAPIEKLRQQQERKEKHEKVKFDQLLKLASDPKFEEDFEMVENARKESLLKDPEQEDPEPPEDFNYLNELDEESVRDYKRQIQTQGVNAIVDKWIKNMHLSAEDEIATILSEVSWYYASKESGLEIIQLMDKFKTQALLDSKLEESIVHLWNKSKTKMSFKTDVELQWKNTMDFLNGHIPARYVDEFLLPPESPYEKYLNCLLLFPTVDAIYKQLKISSAHSESLKYWPDDFPVRGNIKPYLELLHQHNERKGGKRKSTRKKNKRRIYASRRLNGRINR